MTKPTVYLETSVVGYATMRQAIEHVCRRAGYEPPVICTPEELTNDDQD